MSLRRTLSRRRRVSGVCPLAWSGALAALVLAGCGALPSAVPSSLPSAVSSFVPSATASPSATGNAGFVFQAIPTNYTTPLLDVRTDGRQIVWSRGASDSPSEAAPDLWAWTPGDANPHEIYHNPNRDSVLVFLSVDHGHYAFVEVNQRVYGENGFRIWLLAGGTPVQIDRSDWHVGDPGLPVPFVALSDNEAVWATVHRVSAGLRFELLSYSLDGNRTRVLRSADAAKVAFWFPSFAPDGKHLVYATVEKNMGGDAFHVYVLDVSASGSTPVQLDRDGLATMPVINQEHVVWKGVQGNVFNAGMLFIASIARPGDAPTMLGVLGTGLNYPSIGDRYVAAWQQADSDVGLLDVETGQRVSIDPVVPAQEQGRERALVAGELLLYLRADLSSSPKPLELVSVSLPRQ